MKHIVAVLLFAVALPAAAFGQAGQSGLAFLKLGVGGRALGMGEASAATALDPSAAFYNPAALAIPDHPQILIMHKEWIEGVSSEYLSAAVGAGALHLGLSINATS